MERSGRVDDRGGDGAGVPWGALAWVVVLVLWLTWAPFVPREGPVDTLLLPTDSVAEGILNLVLLAPAGLLLGRAGRRSRPRSDALRAAAVLAGIVVLAEGGQVFVAGRHVSLFDALFNLAGGLGGWLAGLRLRASGLRSRSIVLATGSHLFVGVAIYMVTVGTHVGGGHRLAAWQWDYGVRVGDEFEADREYVGRIDSARICAARGGERVCATGGADPAVRRRLTDLATSGQRVELAATVRSASAEQEGPTRIITYSASATLRNATLAQSRRSLVLRLRTPFAGDNGSRIEFELPDALPTGRTTRVRATYDGAHVVLSSRSGERTRRRAFDYRLLTLARTTAWQVEDYRPVQLAGAAAVALMAVFFPVGYGTETALGGHGAAVRLGAAAAGCLVAYTVMAQQLEVGWEWSWAGAALAAGLAGLVAAARDRRGG